MSMEVVASTDALGAEIKGLDLGQELSASDFALVEQALVEHKVLFFRQQPIEARDHHRFASMFGPLQCHPAFPHIDGLPEVTLLASDRENPSKIEKWHSDMTYLECPPLGTVLRGRVIPDKGGDTLFMNMEAAWEALSERLKTKLAPLQAEHNFAHGYQESLAEPGGSERLADAIAANPPRPHPVMRRHPRSDRPCLFVNSLFTTRLLGVEAAESNDLLAQIFEHLDDPRLQTLFEWAVDSIAFWDNRSTQHRPDGQWWPARRRHERTTIAGDRPR
jgi:taurine dioxygenase